MIESIYLDSADYGRHASRYTLLFEKLRAAEAAKHMHDEMAARVSALHQARIAQVRKDLEAEGERLRRAIQVSR